jgi:glycerol-3-phosphate O-acyltransferase
MLGVGKRGRGNQTTKADYIKRLAKVVNQNPKLHDALIKKEGQHYELLKSVFYTQWSAKFFDRIVDAYLEESK